MFVNIGEAAFGKSSGARRDAKRRDGRGCGQHRRESDRLRKLTAKGMENLSGNVGIVMQALVREIRDETMKQMAKAQQETVKEITTSHERTIETLWNAWEKEQQ
ncbi:hypothetical protein FOMG_19801, partial [Fusarium oxysporum f. sp. melonis 26406]